MTVIPYAFDLKLPLQIAWFIDAYCVDSRILRILRDYTKYHIEEVISFSGVPNKGDDWLSYQRVVV